MQVARVAPDWPVPSLMHRRRVMGIVSRMSDLMFTRDGVVAAVAEGGIRGEGPGIWSDRQHGGALDRLMRKLGGEGVRLRFCYEDGVIPARPFRSGCTRW